MNRHLPLLGLCTAMLVAGAPLAAQTVTTGAISGKVLDTSGAPVEGATVRLSSGQIVRTIQTGSDGRYNATLLNGGAWTVKVTKAGFTSQTQTLNVTINSTFQANFRIAREGGATVDVIASSSTIDTTSTTTGASFNLETLTAIPKGRDFTDMAYMSPGVTTSGFNSDNGLNISINGASGAENTFSIDGLKTNDMRYGGVGVNMVSEFIDQVDIQTGGFKPEYNALGGVFTALTRSGSNTFAGSAWSTFTPRGLRPGPKGNSLEREDEAADRYDLGAWVGGAFIADRLFYSVGVNYAYTETPGQMNASNLPVAKRTNPQTQIFSKFNYFLAPSHQLTLSYFGNFSSPKRNSSNTPLDFADARGTMDGGLEEINENNNVNLLYDGNLTPTMTLSVKLGQSTTRYMQHPTSNESAVHDYIWYDTYQIDSTTTGEGPGYVGADGPDVGYRYSRGGYGLTSNEKSKNTQFSIDYSWVIGDHSIKVGYSKIDSEYKLAERCTGPTGDDPLLPGGFRYTITKDSAGYPRLNAYYLFNDATVKANFEALYLQDTWQVTKGLNVFYGFRAEKQVQKDGYGRAFMDFKMGDYMQPRLGFTWDVLGTGKSKLSGSYAIYYEQIPQRMAIRSYSNEIYLRYRYEGSTGQYTYNPNAANKLGTWSGTPSITNYSEGFTFPPLQSGVKLPMRWEAQLGYEQQVTDAIKLGISARYRKLVNPIEDSAISDADGNMYDPSGKATIWNPNPGPVHWTSGGSEIWVQDTLFPRAYNLYKALELSFEYKADRTFLSASYTLSRMKGNYEGLVTSSNGQADANITASWDYYPYVGEGLLPLDRTHQFKAYGYKQFDVMSWPLTVGLNFSWMSGTPLSWLDDGATSNPPRPDIGQYGNAVFQDGKMGNKGRTPSMAKLDLNLEWEIPLGKRVKILPSINIFNLFNSRPAMTRQELATDADGYPRYEFWGMDTSWQEGRSFRFGAKLRF